MKITSLSYIHAFSVGNFLNEKIGIEIELTDTDNEDAAFQLAKSKVHQWASEIQDAVSNVSHGFLMAGEAPRIQSIERPPYNNYSEPSQQIGLTENSIKTCNELMTLEKVYFPLIDKSGLPEEEKRKLWMAYDTRIEELQKQKA